MSVINDIKQKLDIVDVVSEYVALQKAGRNFKALCPFHAEKHPSFFVFPEQQSWHCFGACVTGGDIFSFVMKKEGVDFGQALRLLAERAGVPLIASERQVGVGGEERERLLQINEAAAEYYHHLLLNTSAGKTAMNYITQRDLLLQTIKSFQLGFSPDSWETLLKYLTGKGYGRKELVDAGLVIEGDGGSNYDRFRNRLMFPIRDVRSRVVGFGARALDDSLPKYINSPQTLIFDKSGSFYGIDCSSATIRQKNLVVIVEGYMDVLRAHQHGCQNVVASMGTSLTEKQVAIIKKLTKNLVLALDADVAGEEATLRSAEVMEQALDKKVVPVPMWKGLIRYENVLDAEIRVMLLPQGKDPDDVIRENPLLWSQLVEEALPLVDFALNTVAAKADLKNAKDKSLAVDKLLPLIYGIKDPIRQSHYVQKLARLLKIDERTLRDALRTFQVAERKQVAGKKTQQSALSISSSYFSNPLEEYCLALLLQYPGLKAESAELLPDYFENSEHRELFLKWQQSVDSHSLKDGLDATLEEYLNHLVAKVFPTIIGDNEEERRRELSGCILRLREKWLRSLEAKKEELFTGEDGGGVEAQLAKVDEWGKEVSIQLKEVFAQQRDQQQKIAKRSSE